MITINLDKAKAAAHQMRRSARTAAFAPYDEIIAKQIPGEDAQEAEAARQEIRDRFAAIEEQIEAIASADELHEIISREGLTA